VDGVKLKMLEGLTERSTGTVSVLLGPVMVTLPVYFPVVRAVEFALTEIRVGVPAESGVTVNQWGPIASSAVAVKLRGAPLLFMSIICG